MSYDAFQTPASPGAQLPAHNLSTRAVATTLFLYFLVDLLDFMRLSLRALTQEPALLSDIPRIDSAPFKYR